jgi:site-specific recombinase XerD
VGTGKKKEEVFQNESRGATHHNFKVERWIVAGWLDHALPDVTPHTLRHTFGKNLVDAAVSLEQVAALLGHESLDTAMIGTKPSHGDLEKAVRKAAGELFD